MQTTTSNVWHFPSCLFFNVLLGQWEELAIHIWAIHRQLNQVLEAHIWTDLFNLLIHWFCSVIPHEKWCQVTSSLLGYHSRMSSECQSGISSFPNWDFHRGEVHIQTLSWLWPSFGKRNKEQSQMWWVRPPFSPHKYTALLCHCQETWFWKSPLHSHMICRSNGFCCPAYFCFECWITTKK